MEQNSARKYFASNSPSQGDVTQDILTLLSRAALQDNHPVEFVHRALETSREALNADAAQLLTLQPDGDSFKIHYQAGLKGESIENVFIPGGNGSQAGFTLIRMAPVLTSDLQQEKRFSLCEWEQQHRFRSALSVPVPGNGPREDIRIHPV